MIKKYLELKELSQELVYTVHTTNEVKTISADKISVIRISESDIKVKFDWDTGLKKGITISIPDLEVLLSIYKIILREESSWAVGRPKLYEAKEVEDL